MARHALNMSEVGGGTVRGNEKMEKRKDVKRKVESVTFLVRVGWMRSRVNTTSPS